MVTQEVEWEREVHMDWLTLFIPVKLAAFCLLLYWAARHYFWAVAREANAASRQLWNPDPGKLPNSSSIGRFPRFFGLMPVVTRRAIPLTSRSESWLISAKIYTWRRVSELVVYESEWEREVHMDWLTLFIPIKLAVFCLLLYWAARHYFWAAARDSRQLQLQDPGKLLNSWSYDDACCWTLGV